MDMGRIFSQSFHVYMRNLKIGAPFFVEYLLDMVAVVLFAFSVVLALSATLLSYRTMEPEAALYQLLTGGIPDFRFLGALVFLSLLMVTFFLVIKGAARAATIAMACQAIGGQGADFARGIEGARKHGLAILGFLILLALLMGAALFLPLFPVIIIGFAGATGETTGAFLTIFGILGSAVLALGVYLFTLFVPQEIVVRKTGVLSGIRESVEFVYSHLVDVIEYGMAALAISLVVLFVVPNLFLPITLFSDSLFLNTALEILQALLSILATILLNGYLETVKTAMVMEGR